MIEIKVILKRMVVGEHREFSTAIFVEDEITEEKLKDLTYKIAEYLCKKGDILYQGKPPETEEIK